MSSMQTGGYDPELFVSEIDTTFKCPICHDVMRNPVELPCQHVYCKSCIIQVWNRNGQCPECRQGVKKYTNRDWIYDPPRRYFRNMHSELRLKCDLEGCEHITTIEAYQAHQSTCEFNPNRPVKCQKCKAEMCGFEFNDHECVQYLVTKVNVMEAASGKLEVALANVIADLRATQTSERNINANLELRIKKLETEGKNTAAMLDLLMTQEMGIISIECIRKSDNEQRTVFVKQSDTIRNIHDKFIKELGGGCTFNNVSYPAGGYDTKLFVSDIDEAFKCIICEDVMRNPVELACQHVYCRSCILQVLSGDGQCPQCRQDVEKSTTGDWIYDPPRRYFRNMHSALRLKCDLNGCQHITTIQAYQTHQSTCEFNPNRPVQCQKCKAEMCSFELNDHDCFQYLVTKVNVMEAASNKLQVAFEATQTSAQNTEANLKLRIKELETYAQNTENELRLTIKELEITGKKTETMLDLPMKDLEVISIECIRDSDNEQRTIIVKQSDTLYNIHDKFIKELGSGETLHRVSFPGHGADYWEKTVKDNGIKRGYNLVFYKKSD